ncbi:MAG: T9SS type A sorting domain-containing protein [Bacteroidales bacterium]|nr:T9SS type A sorting domain-containing protein [Bacteroidales bacterium]
MKKNLLLFVLILSILFGYSQSKFIEFTGPNKRLKLKQTTMHPGQNGNYGKEIIGAKKFDFTIIGTTWNDLQTLNYGNVMQRMWAYPDGTVGSTWLSAGQGNIPERGAGYNYFDGTGWDEPDLHVGPEDRMGSPSYAPWGPEGEIIALYRYSAGSGPIYLYKREVKGEGDWTEVELLPPAGAGVSLVWHSMITSGENHEYIHLLAETYDVPYVGQENALLYYRSSDGGDTWDIYEEIIDGLGDDAFATINHLSYAWANPVGETIAFTYGFDEYGGRVFKSEDNGDSWDVIPVFETPWDPFDPPTDTDRFGCGIGTSACALDSEGNVHVVFSRMVKLWEAGETFFEPFTDGMIYWNESMEPLDTTTISAVTMDYLEAGGNLIGWILGDETYEIPPNQPNYANAACAFPQISFDVMDNIFVAYCSLAPGYSNGTNDYRHVIVNSSFDGGTTWEGQKDMNVDLVFIFSECVFPMMPPVIGDYVHITYQEDNEPGIAEWLANHAPVENRIHHMQYEKDFFVAVNENSILPGIEVSECFPNPATGKINLGIKLTQNTFVSIEVLNVLGQRVEVVPGQQMSFGNNYLSIEIANLRDGIYYLNIEVGNTQFTRKFIVQK